MAATLSQAARNRRTARRNGLDVITFVRMATTNAGALPEWSRAEAAGLAYEAAVRAAHWAGLAIKAKEEGR